MSMQGAGTPASSSSSVEHITMSALEKEQPQQLGAEAAFHLNPTEPHCYQVWWSLLL